MAGPPDPFDTGERNKFLPTSGALGSQQSFWAGHSAMDADGAFNYPRDQRRPVSDPSSGDLNPSPPPPPPHGGTGISPSQMAPTGRSEHLASGYFHPMQTDSPVIPVADNLGAAAMEDRLAKRSAAEGGSDHLNVPIDAGSVGIRDSYGSDVALGTAATAPGQVTPGGESPSLIPSHTSQNSLISNFGAPYQGAGTLYYQGYGSRVDPEMINVDEIADDEDDGFHSTPQRRSVFSLPNKSSNDHDALPLSSAGGAAATSGMMGTIGGIFKRDRRGTSPGLSYDLVPGTAEKKGGPVLPKNNGKRANWPARFRALLVGFIILGGIIAGMVVGIVSHFRGKSSGSDSSSTGGDAIDVNSNTNVLNLNSPQIKALMNNPKLHKVFPGVDYTPWGVQYPLCLQYPPSQDNVTQDMVVLSQLTNNIRLYGTDCNQTAMVLYAIDKLQLTNMKVWLGVWIDMNVTTNDRQLAQLYKVIDETQDKSIFNGAIIGNEALYRAGPDIATAETNLINYLQSVRANFTQRKLTLPIATSDLGDNWNEQLVEVVDIVMSNIHPFFGGVPVDQAAGWAWNFWQQHDVSLTKSTKKTQVISEVGWPSGGGTDCGPNVDSCPSQSGAVAGIDQMNKFMADWVCQAINNGTQFFWFEAFDEPWKIQFNTPGKDWEDKWGLMDPARNVKPGLTIPDCGGKQVT